MAAGNGDAAGEPPGDARSSVTGNGNSGATEAAAYGVVALDWTIDRSKDPVRCDQNDAKTVAVLVTREDGSPAGEYQQACGSFSIKIGLEPGRYLADALLVDTSFRDRNSAHLELFEIRPGDRLALPVDFSSAPEVSVR